MNKRASQSRGASYLRRLAKEIPDDQDTHQLLSVLQRKDTPSDYPVAMIGAALIERALEEAILSAMVPEMAKERDRLFSFIQKGPLADFANRILVGYALGFFGPETRQDLECIRFIRNYFAHSPTLASFNQKEVRQPCLDLHITKIAGGPSWANSNSAKGQYVRACAIIAGRIKIRMRLGIRRPGEIDTMATMLP